ncbi:Serine-threonine/tyrosine-protein kinase, catalytic domain [Dillenia turbinata]|uniref:Serine-threonine/tyrosine-protein kinase, catalytic domain n=1 Tax=Dillenia turbinata TaxID=194707 RepID=A0AAN8Z2C8_9MAGN
MASPMYQFDDAYFDQLFQPPPAVEDFVSAFRWTLVVSLISGVVATAAIVAVMYALIDCLRKAGSAIPNYTRIASLDPNDKPTSKPCSYSSTDVEMAIQPAVEEATMDRFLSNMAKEKPIRFSPQQLSEFTHDYVTLLGSGAFGVVFKGEFPNGVPIAVKVLTSSLEDNRVQEQFIAEVSTIGRTYHNNLVRLYGFCFDSAIKALVYEYMENGSLDRLLFGQEGNQSIEWTKLHEIAIGTAKGIAYLHEECEQRIIHYDIKPGNVLIDSDFIPKVADFGLAKLCNRESSHVTMTGCRGTPGYAAPELWKPYPVTHKCDIYSFGMLLFEIVARRRNHDPNLSDSCMQWVPKWTWEMFRNNELAVMLSLCGIQERDRVKAERMSMVALWCVQYLPDDRPLLSTVVKMLEGEIEVLPPPNPLQHLESTRLHLDLAGGLGSSEYSGTTSNQPTNSGRIRSNFEIEIDPRNKKSFAGEAVVIKEITMRIRARTTAIIHAYDWTYSCVEDLISTLPKLKDTAAYIDEVMMGVPLLETMEKKFNNFKNNSSYETISVLPIQLQAIAMALLHNNSSTTTTNNNKKLLSRRELTGTPDNFDQAHIHNSLSYNISNVGQNLAAEVIALPPITWMATNRFVCEICNKGFQRDQKLQLHRRGNNLPGKLRQRSRTERRMRMYVFPEPNCVHHLPACALGDLTGIRKHHSRKHGEKKWTCDKCLKKYALQLDWKGHCDKSECETIFSRLNHVSMDDSVCFLTIMENEFRDDNNKQPCIADHISTLPKLKAPAVYIDEALSWIAMMQQLTMSYLVAVNIQEIKLNPNVRSFIPSQISLSHASPLFNTLMSIGAMVNGRGPLPTGMQMVPMVLPDGRIGYVFQHPGVHMAPPP